MMNKTLQLNDLNCKINENGDKMIIECKEELKKVFENINDIDRAKTLSVVIESQMRSDNVSKDVRMKFLNEISENVGL